MNLWNTHLVKILSRFTSNKDTILFGVTGDIDSLGEYVALNGRARGENLVDHYTNLLDYFLKDWIKRQGSNLIDICFIPAGEEISIYGIAKNKNVPKSLFKAINQRFKVLLRKNHHYLGSKTTSVTFGCEIFTRLEYEDLIIKATKTVKMSSKRNRYEEYLSILEQLRTILALRLDENKFKDLLKGNKRRATLLRKYVYFNLLEYKKKTKRELIHINRLIRACPDKEYDRGLDQKSKKLFSKLRNNI